jgi:hypothetical protein
MDLPSNIDLLHQRVRDAHCPLVTSSDPVVRQVFDQGVCQGIDLRIEIGPSLYATREILDRNCDTMLIFALISNREIEGCQNKPAILSCDHCAAHCSDDLLIKLARYGILVLTYPSHTLHLFQMLYVLLFAVFKQAKNTKVEIIRHHWWWITFYDCFEHMRKQYGA